MQIHEAIRKLVDNEHLTEEQAAAAMEAIMTGQATPAQIAGFLIALRMKGETVSEIAGCALLDRMEKAGSPTAAMEAGAAFVAQLRHAVERVRADAV